MRTIFFVKKVQKFEIREKKHTILYLSIDPNEASTHFLYVQPHNSIATRIQPPQNGDSPLGTLHQENAPATYSNTVGSEIPKGPQPPGMVLKPVGNNGINYTNLNW